VKISVVIPCYRSQATLPSLLSGLHEELAGAVEAYEVILVVDGSPDTTYAVARSLEKQRPDMVRTVLLRRNYGQHNALLAGILRARHEVVVTMDDDLQHRPDQIVRLLGPLEDPLVDLVYGVSEEDEHGFYRSLSSRVVKYGLVLSGVPNAQISGAFRAFRTDLREAFARSADPFVSIDVVLSWATTAVAGTPVRMDRRQEGDSGYTFRSLLRHTWNMVTGYGVWPLRLVTMIGILSSVFGALMLAVLLTMYWTGRIRVDGFTTVVSLVILFSGAIMLSIGILGEYLGRLHFRSMHRPNYLVRVDSWGDRPVDDVAGADEHRLTRPDAIRPGPDAVADALIHLPARPHLQADQ
jgi:glycosyltransferase involved in cell wall biosynthesis